MSDIQRDKKKLQDDLNRLVEDTRVLLGATADVADDSAKVIRTKVEASLQLVQQQIASGARIVEEEIEGRLRTAARHVRANPYSSMGISFGIGLLFGCMLSRR